MDSYEQKQHSRPQRTEVALTTKIEKPDVADRSNYQQQTHNAGTVEPQSCPLVVVNQGDLRPPPTVDDYCLPKKLGTGYVSCRLTSP